MSCATGCAREWTTSCSARPMWSSWKRRTRSGSSRRGYHWFWPVQSSRPRSPTLPAVNVALYAHALLRPDVDYIVREGRLHLVSASRGRVAHRQRWPDGLHAAVEAKEKVSSTGNAQILDWILIQALLGRYERA